MPRPPVLLYLHGIGEDPADDWRDVLAGSLVAAGYPDLADVEVVAPKYPNDLHGVDDDDPLPPVVVVDPQGEAVGWHREEFERRRTSMEQRLGADDPGRGFRGDDLVAEAFLRARPGKGLKQANNYLNDRAVRSAVLNRILGQLDERPPVERLVIVGHSLGSLVAADLLRRLPATLQVAGMVTIGSPLASESLQADGLGELLSTPAPNLGWWVNFWSRLDLICANGGLGTAFPWILDRHVVGKPVGPRAAHSAVTYLRHRTVALAIGHGLFGPVSTERAAVAPHPDEPLDEAERYAVMALRLAHLTLHRLEGDVRDRYAGALRRVQDTTYEQLVELRRKDGRPVPSAVGCLAVDLGDPGAVPPEAQVPPSMSASDAAVPLVSVASANLLSPFEIEVDHDVRRDALKRLALELGPGSKMGDNVLAAIEESRQALKGPTNWVKWAAIGLGAVAVVATPVGLAMAAAGGLAGAAAVTSALAAFGPGGMVGGLLTAGSLLTAGGGSIAVGLAAPGTSAEAVEVTVAGYLTVAIVRKKQGLDVDPSLWSYLLDLDDAVSRELSKISALSDKSSQSVKELRRKLDAVNRAIDYLQNNGMSPQPLGVLPVGDE